jgi:hypothetical protein
MPLGEAGRMTTAAAIEQKILDLLATRQDGATLCPSEVARALLPVGGHWRELMPQVRQVAQAMVRGHRLSVTRGGVSVDATSPGGGGSTGSSDPRGRRLIRGVRPDKAGSSRSFETPRVVGSASIPLSDDEALRGWPPAFWRPPRK